MRVARIRKILLFFILFVSSVVCHIAESSGYIYVFRDAEGHVHYSNSPPYPASGSPASPSLVKAFGPAISDSLRQTIRSISTQYGADADLVWAVIKVESNFNPRAVSQKGAMGLMQIMPETARLYGVRDPYDPNENVTAGVRHLKYLMDYFKGDLRLVLAAYNSGILAVEKLGSMIRYPETRKYVSSVLSHYRSVNPLPSQ